MPDVPLLRLPTWQEEPLLVPPIVVAACEPAAPAEPMFPAKPMLPARPILPAKPAFHAAGQVADLAIE